MNSSHRMRSAAVCCFVLTLLTPFGCRSAEGAGQAGAGISGPLTMQADYDTRAPRTCAPVKSPPSAAQAAVMVQCSMDALSATGLGLIQDVKLEMGSPRAFVYYTDEGLAGVFGGGFGVDVEDRFEGVGEDEDPGVVVEDFDAVEKFDV